MDSATAVEVLSEADVLAANELAESAGLDASRLLFAKWMIRMNRFHDGDGPAAPMEEVKAWLHRYH